ncbi:MAG: hypothetical protein JXB07_02505 [Anaerolineae bacterium]|nr:hypothetical protein [Anaerolineae bacterium]
MNMRLSRIFICKVLGICLCIGLLITTPGVSMAALSQQTPNTCELYPIVIPAALLVEAKEGDTLPELANGIEEGDFGWLTWTANPDEAALIASLTPPGDSDTYVNPLDADDKMLSQGDWAMGNPALSDNEAAHAALDELKAVDISVPVWDSAGEQDGYTGYQISAFARVRLLDYHLGDENRISVQFLGYTCQDTTSQNASIELSQTVDSATVPPTPNVDFTVSQDNVLPGDELTYTTTVTNTMTTLLISGTLRVTNTGSSPATIAYYSDVVEYQAAGSPDWVALAGTASVLPDYSPISAASTTSGMLLSTTGIPSDGVTYATGSDAIVGTSIAAGSTASWTYQAIVTLNAEQVSRFLTPGAFEDLRNSILFEIGPDAAEPGQPFTQSTSVLNVLEAQSGDLTDVRLTLTMPDGKAVTVNAAANPDLTEIAPGGSVAVKTPYAIPAIAAREKNESVEAYLARLEAADEALLTAMVDVAAGSDDAAVMVPQQTVSAVQHLPILTMVITKPENTQEAAAAAYNLTLTNTGSAPAGKLEITGQRTDGTAITINDIPNTLDPGATAVAHIPHSASLNQLADDLASAITLTWQDTGGASYGPVEATTGEPREKIALADEAAAADGETTPFDFEFENWEAPRLPSLKDFQVSQFTGAATYSYPIQVPPGPGGLQPSLALSYSSQVVDNASGMTQASWVGMGWSMETGAIERNLHGTMDFRDDDTFSLNVNGISGLLLLESSTGSIENYQMANESFMRIQRDTSTDIWTVWDKTGTQYFFGEQAALPNNNRAQYHACNPEEPVTWKWALSRVRNNFGQELIYINRTDEPTRLTELCDQPVSPDAYGVDNAIYPEYILYRFSDGTYSPYRIEFVRQEDMPIHDIYHRGDWEHEWYYGKNPQYFFERSRLKEIQIQHDADNNNTYEQIIRKYVLTYANDNDPSIENTPIFPNYTWSKGGKTLTLMKIQEYGFGGATSLPPTIFNYGDGITHGDAMHLEWATNGYGGKVSFTYDKWSDTTSSDNSKFEQDFTLLCPSSEGGWGGDCDEQQYLPIHDLSSRLIPVGLFHPGGRYELHAELSAHPLSAGTTVQIGLTGAANKPEPAVALSPGKSTTLEEVFDLSSTVDNQARWSVTCEDCSMTLFRARWLPTYYRVTAKTITDAITGASSTLTYRYDEPATNDPEHSAYVDGIRKDNGTLDFAKQYTQAYSEFRGHGMVEEIAPDGLVNATFFYQDDEFRGNTAATVTHTREMTEPFNSLDENLWHRSAGTEDLINVERLNGDSALRIQGSPEGNWVSVTRWQGDAGAHTIGNGEFAMLQFRRGEVTENDQINLTLQHGDWDQPEYRRWGFSILSDGAANAEICQWDDKINESECHSDGSLMNIEQDKWYVLLIGIDNEQFMVRVWQRDDPAQYAEHYRAFTGSEWRDQNWQFMAQVKNATIWLDEYNESRLYSLNETLYEADTEKMLCLKIVNDGGEFCLSKTWAYPIQSRSYAFEGDAEWVGKSTYYKHEAKYQDNAQYGNQTQVIESSWNWDNRAFQDHRVSWTAYHPNAAGDTYLVGLPGHTNTYECPAGSQNGSCYEAIDALLNNAGNWAQDYILSSHWYLYDDAFYVHRDENFATPPTIGHLTGERDLLRYVGEGFNDRRYRDTEYAYDDYGNRITVTTWTGEGTFDEPATAGIQNVYSCYGGGETVGEEACQVDHYHTYALWTKNDLGQKTILGYSGIAVPGTDATGYSLGVPVSRQDPNEAANEVMTRVTYDSFGRLRKVIKPGENDDAPTNQIVYYDAYPGGSDPVPLMVEMWQRVEGTDYYSQRKFYNGLGQLIQAQTTRVNVGADLQDVIVDYQYDDNGRLIKQTVPYAIGAWTSWGSSPTPWRGQAIDGHEVTTTSYDDLGRPEQVTAPDLTVTGYEYGDLYTTVTDPRGTHTTSYSDIWGRTTLVEALEGANVRYHYDVADRLVRVDQLSTGPLAKMITTTLSYDLAGRKIEMNDPDMGVWSYSYDALGNLSYQDDAKGQRVCLYYDNLNRLSGKRYANSGDVCPVVPDSYTVEYVYDNIAGGNNGIGRRTGMIYSSGKTSWTYDVRGRVTSEVHDLTQFGPEEPYTISYTYNRADQPVTVTYPDGEIVTTTYDNQMRPIDLSSSLNVEYASDALFDVFGRLYDLTAGNGLHTRYSFYKPSIQGGRLENLTVGDDLLNLTYHYDAIGNIEGLEDDSHVIGGQKTKYEYDKLNRLMSAVSDGGPTGAYTQKFAYDDLGRLNAKTTDGQTLDYTYPGWSEPHPHAATGMGEDNRYEYDANGNMVTRTENGIEYTQAWTVENKLEQVNWVKNGEAYETRYVYDGDGNRIAQIERVSGSEADRKWNRITVYVGGIYEEVFEEAGPGLSPIDDSDDGKDDNILPIDPPTRTNIDIEDIDVDNALDDRTIGADEPVGLSQNAGEERLEDPSSGLNDIWDWFTDLLKMPGQKAVGIARPAAPPSEAPEEQALSPLLAATTRTWTSKADFLTGYLLDRVDVYDLDGSMRLFTYNDNFSDNELNPARYTVSSSSLVEQNSRAERPASTTNRSLAFKNLTLSGDFDIQVDYGMLAYTNVDVGPRLGMSLTCQNSNYLSFAFAANYYPSSSYRQYRIEGIFRGWEDDGNRRLDFQSDDSSYDKGSLRIVRTGTTWEFYYKRSGDAGFTFLGKRTENELGTGAYGNCSLSLNSTQWYKPADPPTPNKAYAAYFDNFLLSKNNGHTNPYTSIGTWRAEVDGGKSWVAWQSFNLIGSWGGSTGFIISGRSCTGANGTGTCAPWYAIPNPTASNNWPASVGNYRYFQVEVLLSGGASTPQMDEIRLNYNPDTVSPSNPIPPAIETHGAKDNAWQNSASTPSFTWTASSDSGSGIAKYNIYWGTGNYSDNPPTTHTSTSPSFTAPSAVASGSTYYLWVQAEDKVLNKSGWKKMFTFRYETTLPSNPIPPATETHGAKNNVWQNSISTPSFTWTASTDTYSGMAGYNIYWGTGNYSDNPPTTHTSTSPGFTAPSAVASGSTYYLWVQAKDNATNKSAWRKMFTFRYDVTLPTNPTPPATETHGVQNNVEQNDVSDPAFTWSGASDAHSGVAGYNVYWGTDANGTSITASPTTPAYDPVGDVPDNSTTFLRVQTKDNAGNLAAWVTMFTFRYGSSGGGTPVGVTKYYYLGGQRVAMRTSEGVFYLNGDHLGSTSLVTNQDGTPVSESRYLPFGEPYWTDGDQVTDYTFTGQRDDGFGLMDYNARYYSPVLGRFIQADTIIPEGIQGLDRYAYVNNNPTRFVDPTGHNCEDIPYEEARMSCEAGQRENEKLLPVLPGAGCSGTRGMAYECEYSAVFVPGTVETDAPIYTTHDLMVILRSLHADDDINNYIISVIPNFFKLPEIIDKILDWVSIPTMQTAQERNDMVQDYVVDLALANNETVFLTYHYYEFETPMPTVYEPNRTHLSRVGVVTLNTGTSSMVSFTLGPIDSLNFSAWFNAVPTWTVGGPTYKTYLPLIYR